MAKTKERVEKLMERRKQSWVQIEAKDKDGEEEVYKRISVMSGQLFGNIRYFFTKFAINKLHAFFYDPM
jgi:hypothetical protein